jgi:hypothetical protein
MDDDQNTPGTPHPNRSTENRQPGDARELNEHLDKDRESTETIPRKSSLLGNPCPYSAASSCRPSSTSGSSSAATPRSSAASSRASAAASSA